MLLDTVENSMAHIKFNPEWAKFEEDMHSSDPQKAQEATEKFTAARDHAVRTDSQARRWEESRKEGWAKDKPQWVKKRIKAENEPLEMMKKSLRQGGSFDTGFKPAPGYVIVEVEKKETKTEAGIYIPDEATDGLKNTGIILDVGDELIVGETKTIKSPCSIGDTVMFKKGAGLEMEIADRDCRFMQFSDILGIFYE